MDRIQIENRIRESIEVKSRILNDKPLLDCIYETAELLSRCLFNGSRIFLCGNGGSASDAMHIAGELIGRFQKDRVALPVIALNTDVAAITAIANDFGYEKIYERQIEGNLKPKDVLIGISTSGNSDNIYRAICTANNLGGHTVALLGKDGGKIKGIAEYSLVVPSDCTARIQESHIMIGHIICELVEEKFG